MAKKKIINVNIKCFQVVEYNQEVVMNQEDYDALVLLNEDDVDERNNPKEYHLINDYLDPRDIIDAAQEFTGFEIEIVN